MRPRGRAADSRKRSRRSLRRAPDELLIPRRPMTTPVLHAAPRLALRALCAAALLAVALALAAAPASAHVAASAASGGTLDIRFEDHFDNLLPGACVELYQDDAGQYGDLVYSWCSATGH